MRTRYSAKEVRRLVEEYDDLMEKLDTNHYGLRWVAHHVDIFRAYNSLSKPQREAILLHGFYGYGLEASGKLLDVHHTTVYRRYMRGLDAMVTYLNGAHEHQLGRG